ncbi:hypothetical protein [Timonella sp. A28]|uniref:hypothetical protein n=1 Tax=Timonella sp. A28 TaxID=3442640 RepID=UPI003EB709FF
MGFDNLVNKAKEALSGTNKDELIAQAKEAATDERIDQVADAIKQVAPDSVDSKIDGLAEKAKDLNN